MTVIETRTDSKAVIPFLHVLHVRMESVEVLAQRGLATRDRTDDMIALGELFIATGFFDLVLRRSLQMMAYVVVRMILVLVESIDECRLPFGPQVLGAESDIAAGIDLRMQCRFGRTAHAQTYAF